MFDRITAEEIVAAPELSGVVNADLPAMITDAYVRVSVAKSLIGEESTQSEPLFDELRSIAAAQLAIAMNIGPGELRKSAAFVSASAYQVLSMGFPAEGDESSSLLQPNAVSSRVSALLLFLAADAAADAAEVAKDLPDLVNQPHLELLTALKAIGSGNLSIAGRIELPDFAPLPGKGPSQVAADFAYRECAGILIGLLRHLSNTSDGWRAGRFGELALRLGREFDLQTPGGTILVENLFAGPWHVARLLDLVEPIAIASATGAIPVPTGVDVEEWGELLERIAGRRPLLWRNHREAIGRGLLESGTSAALAFPTGAGKSTVSELKIASAVLRGRNVICLVPTLSLIDQFSAAVSSTLPGAKVTAQRDIDELIRPNLSGAAEVFVMTPESCLAAMAGDIERFGDVGLVVFDEAHLIHAEGSVPTRRSLDASLCLLTLNDHFHDADILLVSAMFANAQFLANWISELTGRPALDLSNPWKPTRQARGALLYRPEEISQLRDAIADRFRTSSNLTPPADLQRSMSAEAWGLFGLRSTWQTTNVRDYRFVKLLQEPVSLSVGGHRTTNGAWWLNPNANKVAARVASASAESGLKTLVFSQQVKWAVAVANDVSEALNRVTPLTAAEKLLLERAVETLGEESALYLSLVEGAVVGSAIPHHGLLLPEERRLHERLYKRNNGVPVLVATSTVAQGMNFPSELVVIAGDKRFDSTANRRTQLEAHELLNAAGRAGRAGDHSNALVLVIPGEVVAYDGGGAMDSGWFLLQKAFAQSDQCIDVIDPLAGLLDALESEEPTDLDEYFLRRVGSAGDLEAGSRLLSKSLAAYAARQQTGPDWLSERLAILARSIGDNDLEPWLKRATSVTGLPPTELLRLATKLDGASSRSESLIWWRDWFLDFLAEAPGLLDQVLRVGSRAALRGTSEELGDWALATSRIVDEIRVYLDLWMSGATLARIQAKGVERRLTRQNIRLEFARKFVLRVLPDLAYLFGLPALVQRQRAAFGLTDELPDDHPLVDLPRAVELGVDTEAKLASLVSNPALTRTRVHAID